MAELKTKAAASNLLDDSYLVTTSSPHIKSKNTTQSIMRDVVIALIPTSLAGTLFFGFRALAIIAVSVAFAVLSEYGFQKLTNKKVTVTDLSAVVTGLLLALNVPVSAPLWVVAFGSIFAIILVKHCFGGLGSNFMNPALAARAFILASWPETISKFTMDSVTTATPLTVLKTGGKASVTFMDALIGRMPGTIGEVSAIAIIIGAAYLLYKKVISWHIPVAYIGTVLVLTTVIGGANGRNGLTEIFFGGLMLGAFFMATDYSTSPMTKTGQLIFGFGCGLITTLIRLFGGYPEGVTYGIILMNLVVPVIDHFTIPKRFGTPKKAK